MSNQRRNRKTTKGPRYTAMGKAKARTKLAANVTEEHEWYLDTPDIRLTRIFTIVLLLHAVAFGGILAFKMVDKASANTAITISSARSTFESAVQEGKEVAAAVPARTEAPAEDPARVRPPAPLRRSQTDDNQYKVQAGDTLPEIAASLKVDVAALRQANSIISDNELYPGRWLKVPTAAEIAAAKTVERPAQAKPAPAPAPAAPSTGTYEVRPGDTAWAIAQKLGVSYHDLMKINGVSKPETLQIGQKLRVPGAN
ncbi:MAG: LysM peptidoglycan-binding domain-containing protein [Verrucomicrobiales bacterium]|nr:LysM peptidoglycan-binding domain-containing protein [Verrucomicrobiales bacterium]